MSDPGNPFDPAGPAPPTRRVTWGVRRRYEADGLLPDAGPLRTRVVAVVTVPLIVLVLLIFLPWPWSGHAGGAPVDYGSGQWPGAGGGSDGGGTADYTSSAEAYPTDDPYTTDPYTTDPASIDPYATDPYPTDTPSTDLLTPDTSSTETPPEATEPGAVVTAYFDAINNGDFGTAWQLAGQNVESDYATFVAGFENTEYDTVTVLSVDGGTVTATLDSEQKDGTHSSFAGTYTVQDGVITATDVRQTG